MPSDGSRLQVPACTLKYNTAKKRSLHKPGPGLAVLKITKRSGEVYKLFACSSCRDRVKRVCPLSQIPGNPIGDVYANCIGVQQRPRQQRRRQRQPEPQPPPQLEPPPQPEPQTGLQMQPQMH